MWKLSREASKPHELIWIQQVTWKPQRILGYQNGETLKFVQDKKWRNIFQNETSNYWASTGISSFKRWNQRHKLSDQRKPVIFLHGPKAKIEIKGFQV